MEVTFVHAGDPVASKIALAQIVFESTILGGVAAQAAASSRFTGAKGQTLDILAPAGVDAARLVLVGAGPENAYDAMCAEHAAASAYVAVKLSGLETLRVELPHGGEKHAARAALGIRLASYCFDRYRTRELEDKKQSITSIQIVTPDAVKALADFGPLAALADAVIFSRDLVSEPPNILFPAEYARRVKELSTLGLEVEILGEPEMTKLGMGSLLAVGRGSVRESQLVVIRWNGAVDPSAQPVAFVGKGVCFDTGGISIKPAENMDSLKDDMSGSAAVVGLMHVLAGRKAKVNAIGILGLVENMPGGDAYRPGDVLTSMSGQTIEVINTDAEGRLVLADAIWYCQGRFNPKFIVDLATLTGGIVVSLGNDLAGIFSDNEELAGRLISASNTEGEPLWRMPLPKQYEKKIDSTIADMKNTGGRPGSAITAALFIKRFTNAVPWAHLDIAGTAWKAPSDVPTNPDGATGYGVRLLNRMVAENYES